MKRQIFAKPKGSRQILIGCVLARLCTILAGGCQFDSPMSSSPVGKIDPALIGVWKYDDKTVKFSSSDDTHYKIDYDGKSYSAYPSDIGSTRFITLKVEKNYLFASYNISEGGKNLTLKFVNYNLLNSAADTAAIHKIIEKNSNNPKLYDSSEMVLEADYDFALDMNELERIFEMVKADDAHRLEARDLYKKGDYAGTVKILADLVDRLFPKPDDIKLRAETYFKLKDYDSALKDVTNLMKESAGNLTADQFVLRGDIYKAMYNNVMADADYRKALEIDPNNEAARKKRDELSGRQPADSITKTGVPTLIEYQSLFKGYNAEYKSLILIFNQKSEAYVSLEKAQKNPAAPDTMALCQSLSALSKAASNVGTLVEKIYEMFYVLKSRKAKLYDKDATELDVFISEDEDDELGRILEENDQIIIPSREVIVSRMIKYKCK